MLKSEIDPPKPKIEAPNCPKCGTQMWIARIESDEPGHHKRTYECPECNHSIFEIVKI
jgi:predicted RNA-binding Zn-ribbon protein involved in translation (DUF1610 family)